MRGRPDGQNRPDALEEQPPSAIPAVDLSSVSLTRFFFEGHWCGHSSEKYTSGRLLKIMAEQKIGTILNFSSQSPPEIGKSIEYFAPAFFDDSL
jgi:hypothetical protein